MAGTVLITGANGSLALGFVASLLKSYPEHTLVATVRNPSSQQDPNTAKLQAIIAKHPQVNVLVEKLDLSSLAAVRLLAEKISRRISSGEIPRISAIVCNAFAWSLNGMKTTSDGYEATFQVSHLSHFLLVLKLLGSMDAASGRIVMLGSGAHYPERENPLCKLRPGLPNHLEQLLHPADDDPAQVHDRGFQRYGTAKLANVMFANHLSERLDADPRLGHITVLTMDPGGLVGSRAQVEQKAPVRAIMAGFNLLMPVLKHVTQAFRTTEDSGCDLVAVSVGPEFQGKKGYFVGLNPDSPARASFDAKEQKRLWDACWEWAGLSEGETVLQA